MSGLRDNLEEWALGHGEHIAAVVSEHESAGRRAIRSRRRNRVLATATTAIVAALGVVAVASALPGDTATPAAQDLSRHLSELVCGDPWLVESGTTPYISDAGSYYDEPQGDWVLTDDNGDMHTDFTGFTALLGSVSWQGEIGLHNHTIVRARTVAVKLGEIVGVSQEQYAQIFDPGVAGINLSAPRPGACGEGSPGSTSGKVTYHLVLQVQRVGDGGGPVATLVDPGGPLTVDIDDVEAYVAAHASPRADPRAPQGDLYQAFVVPRPTEYSCRPYQDLIASGEPSVTAMTYNVTIPGIRPRAQMINDESPVVATVAGGVDAWFTRFHAWLVIADGSNPTRPVAWNSDGTELAYSETAPRPPAEFDCVVPFNYVPPSGTIYLVIDGVDPAALAAAYPGADYSLEGMQTWVYLGEAG